MKFISRIYIFATQDSMSAHKPISLRDLAKHVLLIAKKSKNGITQDSLIKLMNPPIKEEEKDAMKKRVSEVLNVLVGAEVMTKGINSSYTYSNKYANQSKTDTLIRRIRLLIMYHILINRNKNNNTTETICESSKIKFPVIVIAGKGICAHSEADKHSCDITCNDKFVMFSPGMIMNAMNFSVIEQTEYATSLLEENAINEYVYTLLLASIVDSQSKAR